MKKYLLSLIVSLCTICMTNAANYLTFTAEEDGSTFKIVNNGNNNPNIEYSLDEGKTWTALTANVDVTLTNKGDITLLRGDNPNGFSSRIEYHYIYSSFAMTGKIAASGSVMSLIDGAGETNSIPDSYCFYGLFENCNSLIQAPELPATTLANGCYCGMFSGCASLSQAPKLQATALSSYCYESMFSGCANLIQAPELPATTLADGCYESMFSGCASLIQAPELPATVLSSHCYESMFSGCASLTQAPELPATIMEYYCYRSMFSGCTSLPQAPKLPATALHDHCYESMFSGCTSLMQAPELPATILFDYCYRSMFSGCSNLTQAPELPATTLSKYCYRSMFSGCSNLTQAPELTATTLAYACYESMFSGCTGLPQAPKLPANTLADSCYRSMFEGCTSLAEIKISNVFDNWDSYTYEWVRNVAPTGTFICPKKLPLEYGTSRIPEGWTVKYFDDKANYLTFTAEEEGSTFGIVNNYGNNPNIEYSKDEGKTWTTLTAYTNVTLANKGDKALLRGDNPQGFSFAKSYAHFTSFTMTGKIAASGSVMSLIDGVGESDIIPDSCCFYGLFENCKSLIQAPELPATTLADYCYSGMFSGCTSLTQVTELPATILAPYCYSYMYKGCTNLTQAPELPATTLASSCYESMFEGCTNLTQAPELPATTLASSCYFWMFRGCTGLTQAPELPATTLADYCYEFMFEGCTSLTQAPELPATTLASHCFLGMFSSCASLTQVPELSATTLADGCYESMFSGCASLTQAPELPATTLADYCYESMFSGCTSLTQAPELSATTLADYCYSKMFSGCTSLTQAPELPATTLASSCYSGIFSGCTSLTQAPELPATTLAKECYRSMFEGCTSLSEISVVFDNWDSYTYEWVRNVAPTGTFICSKKLSLIYGVNRIPDGWTVKYIDDITPDKINYLTFTAEEDGSTFRIVNNEDNNPNVSPNIEYSLDEGKTWTALTVNTNVTLANKGDKALLRGDNPTDFSFHMYEGVIYSSFTMTGKIAASGSVMSLIDGVGMTDVIPNSYCFYGLFKNCESLTQAPELPATTLTTCCYWNMFNGCTGLTQAPELPATTLAEWCYSEMFEGCTSLTQAPELPAMSLTYGCYEHMFRGCTGLTQAPELPATILAHDCYKAMFYGCTSLSQAPKLPATTLDDYCYYGMFYGCTSLSEISVVFDNWENSYTKEWVVNVAPTGTFICPKDLPLEYGVGRIPEGWTVKYKEDTAVPTVAADGIAIWTEGRTIYVRGAKNNVSLFDVSGKFISSSSADADLHTLTAPAQGVYIINADGKKSTTVVQ